MEVSQTRTHATLRRSCAGLLRTLQKFACGGATLSDRRTMLHILPKAIDLNQLIQFIIDHCFLFESPPMPDTTPASHTRQQLLLAALRLFAENGIHAVSLRSINQAAGARNSGAVHYHFENKTGLLLALVDDLMDRLAEFRGNSLRQLAERAEPASVRECLDVFYRPNWLLHFDPEVGRISTKFFLLHQMTPVAEVQQRLTERASPNWHLLEQLLLRALPHKDPQLLRIHIGMSWVGVLNGLAALDLLAVTPFGDMRSGSLEQMLPAFQQYLAAGVSC